MKSQFSFLAGLLLASQAALADVTAWFHFYQHTPISNVTVLASTPSDPNGGGVVVECGNIDGFVQGHTDITDGDGSFGMFATYTKQDGSLGAAIVFNNDGLARIRKENYQTAIEDLFGGVSEQRIVAALVGKDYDSLIYFWSLCDGSQVPYGGPSMGNVYYFGEWNAGDSFVSYTVPTVPEPLAASMLVPALGAIALKGRRQ